MLNHELDLNSLAARFADRRRLQITDPFQPDAAEAIEQCLAREVPWTLAYRSASRSTKIPNERLSAMSERELFRVPARHCVSMVEPWAGGPRLAITGWMRSD